MDIYEHLPGYPDNHIVLDTRLPTPRQLEKLNALFNCGYDVNEFARGGITEVVHTAKWGRVSLHVSRYDSTKPERGTRVVVRGIIAANPASRLPHILNEIGEIAKELGATSLILPFPGEMINRLSPIQLFNGMNGVQVDPMMTRGVLRFSLSDEGVPFFKPVPAANPAKLRRALEEMAREAAGEIAAPSIVPAMPTRAEAPWMVAILSRAERVMEGWRVIQLLQARHHLLARQAG